MTVGSASVRATARRLRSKTSFYLELLFLVRGTEFGSIFHFKFFDLLEYNCGHIVVIWKFIYFLWRAAWRNNYCLNSFIRLFFILLSLFSYWFLLSNRNFLRRFVGKGDITNDLIFVPLPRWWFLKDKFILAVLNIARLIDWSHAAIKSLLKFCHFIIII